MGNEMTHAKELAHLILHGVHFGGYWWNEYVNTNVCCECSSYIQDPDTDEIIHDPACVYHEYVEEQARIHELAKLIIGEEND
jgi:hypothetical protein